MKIVAGGYCALLASAFDTTSGRGPGEFHKHVASSSSAFESGLGSPSCAVSVIDIANIASSMTSKMFRNQDLLENFLLGSFHSLMSFWSLSVCMYDLRKKGA
eukprot:scaffold2696_cov104-Cylindrotheca_fusiformis.AAC.6